MKLITDRDVAAVRAYFVTQGEDPLVVEHIPAVTLLYHLRDQKTAAEIYAIYCNTKFPIKELGYGWGV